MKSSLCRPDDNHWCIECCRSNCPLLGDINDGKTGCLGHNGQRFNGLTKTNLCQEFDCLANQTDKERKFIRQTIITQLPPGQFKMSEVLDPLDLPISYPFSNIKSH